MEILQTAEGSTKSVVAYVFIKLHTIISQSNITFRNRRTTNVPLNTAIIVYFGGYTIISKYQCHLS
jgi:hypothetical protein